MIERMVDESRKKRAQMAMEETFEPIAIDFGFEDSVAFDSDQDPINFENQGEELLDRDDSSKASATRGVVDDQESCEAIKNALNEQCGTTPAAAYANSPRDSPHLSPNTRRGSVQRSSICLRTVIYV